MAGRAGALSLFASVLAVVAIAAGAPAAGAATLAQVAGGKSELHVPWSTLNQVGPKGIQVSPISPAWLTFRSFQEGPVFNFPIVGGAVAYQDVLGTPALLGNVEHSGGLLMQKWNLSDSTVENELEVLNLEILNGTTLAGDALGVVPSPVGNLVDVSVTENTDIGVIYFEATVEMDAATAAVMNTYFATDAFTSGLVLGRLKSEIQLRRELIPTPHPRPQSAREARTSLVPAFNACTSPNRVHGPPLDSGSCNPPVQRSSYVTVGSSFEGSFRMSVLVGDPGTSTDDADVRLVASLSDVRRRSNGTDYIGELEARVTLRLTDRLNGAAQDESATLADLPLELVVPCAGTSDPDAGAQCSTSTTADAVVPGMVAEGARAVWGLDQVTVTDGGVDGVAGTDPNGVFAVQGIFVP